MRWYRKTWMSDDYLVRVNPPSGPWRPLLLASVMLLSGWASVAVLDAAPRGAWYRALAGVIVGVLMVVAALSVGKRIMAYRSGWLEGRGAMVASLIEATKRGYTLAEWIDSQAEVDSVLLGIRTGPTGPEVRTENDGEAVRDRAGKLGRLRAARRRRTVRRAGRGRLGEPTRGDGAGGPEGVDGRSSATQRDDAVDGRGTGPDAGPGPRADGA